MYLSQNSRYVLRKSFWTSSNILERKFKICCTLSRARWPEDDPSKPPLRLNIPRDTGISNPFQFSSQFSLNGRRRSTNDHTSASWVASAVDQNLNCKYDNNNINDTTVSEREDVLIPSHTIEKNENDTGKNVEDVEEIKLIESLDSVKGKSRNISSRRGKSFKVKKVRNYDGVSLKSLNSISKECELDKNGILTIQIALNDKMNKNMEDDEDVSKVIEVEDPITDEQVRALAQAIINELEANEENAQLQPGGLDQKSEEDAYLVIINVSDKESPSDDISSLTYDMAEPLVDQNLPYLNKKHTGMAGAEAKTSPRSRTGGYTRQVRDLEFCDEMDKSIFKKKTERSRKFQKSLGMEMKKNSYNFPLCLDISSVSRNGTNKANQTEFLNNYQGNSRLKKNGTKKENIFNFNGSDILKEKEKRKELFERSIRKAKKDKLDAQETKKSDVRKVRTSGDQLNMEKTQTQRFIESITPFYTELQPEEKLYNPTNFINPNDLGKIEFASQALVEETTGKSERQITLSMLKPLSKQVTLIDELPELLKYPEYKYTVLQKTCGNSVSLDDDKMNYASRTVRSYHVSSKNASELRKDDTGEKVPVVMGKNEKEDKYGFQKKNPDEGTNMKLIANTDVLSKDYYKNNKNNSCEVYKNDSKLSDNDIYLQEVNEIGNILPSTEGKSPDKNVILVPPGSTTEWNGKTSQTLPDPIEERYEPDLTDAKMLSKTKYPSNSQLLKSSFSSEEGKKNKAEWIKTFSVSEIEKFEMNRMCLNMEKSTEENNGKDLPLMNRKKDIILNVVKDIPVSNPKLSDNIVNLANEDLAQNKGLSSLDSLSLMKRVKEIVDMDLKNAEKIFIPAESEKAPEDEQAPEEQKPKVPTGTITSNLNSVVVFDEVTNRFYVNTPELEHMMNIQREELNAMALSQPTNSGNNMKILDLSNEEFNDLVVYVPEFFGNTKYVLKSGDSVVFYDEQRNKFNIDFNRGLNIQHDQIKEQKQGKVEQEEVEEEDEAQYREVEERKENMEEQSQAPEEMNKVDQFPEQDKKSPKYKKEKTSTDELFPKNGSKSKSVPKVEHNTGHQKNSTEHKSEIDGRRQEKKDIEKKEKHTLEEKQRFKKEVIKENAEEIRRKNSDLYHDVFDGKKKDMKSKKDENNFKEPPVMSKKGNGLEKSLVEHYVSENIVQMSKQCGQGKTGKLRSNKIETVKININPTKRLPSKVTEINLNRKCEEGNGSMKKNSIDSNEVAEAEPKILEQPGGTFYKKFEKYKTPFSDPEYEDKPMKISSDLESNPNLKKLDSRNKTLVLHEISKSSENVESWLKDETNKMATLLLKVLQDAADGNNKRRIVAKTSEKGNPYEAIRKKQENSLLKNRKRGISPVKGSKSGQKFVQDAKVKQGKITLNGNKKDRFPLIEDDSHVEVMPPESLLQKDQILSLVTIQPNEISFEEIPGPVVLKKLSGLWKTLPDIGCQATIFTTMRMFQMVKMSLGVVSPEVFRTRSDPFARLFAKYGPVVKLQGPLSGEIVLVNRPEDINSVFSQTQTCPGRSVLDSLENCRNRLQQKKFPIGINSTYYGIEWDILRRTAADISSRGCLSCFGLFKNADTMFLNKIQTIKNKQNTVPDDFINEVKKWSMEGLCSVIFDKSLGFLEKKNSQMHWISESERLLRHMGEATDCLCQCESRFQMWRFFNTPAMNCLTQAYQTLDLILSKNVYQAEISLRKKRKNITNNKHHSEQNLNFLESMLLNDQMTSDEVTANLTDMLLIGANTTTIALGFLLYHLAQNSRIQQQLFKEIRELLPSKNSQLNYHQLHSLKYLQACVKEVTRLNVPIPLVVKLIPNDITLTNYRVPMGSYMVLDNQTACMKSQNFDEPEKFKPERWLDMDCIHPFSSIPFCTGPRAGFIKRLTEVQLWTCIAKIIRNYQLEYHYGEIKGTGNFFSYPDKPLKLTFLEREE